MDDYNTQISTDKFDDYLFEDDVIYRMTPTKLMDNLTDDIIKDISDKPQIIPLPRRVLYKNLCLYYRHNLKKLFVGHSKKTEEPVILGLKIPQSKAKDLFKIIRTNKHIIDHSIEKV